MDNDKLKAANIRWEKKRSKSEAARERARIRWMRQGSQVAKMPSSQQTTSSMPSLEDNNGYQREVQMANEMGIERLSNIANELKLQLQQTVLEMEQWKKKCQDNQEIVLSLRTALRRNQLKTVPPLKKYAAYNRPI